MAYGSNGSRVSFDRFGNEIMVVGLKDKKGTGYPKAYVQIKNQLYKIEVTKSNKEGVEGWVRLTKVPRRNNSGSF